MSSNPAFIRQEVLRLGPYQARILLEGDTGPYLSDADYERRLGPLRVHDAQPDSEDMEVILRASAEPWPRPGQPQFYEITTLGHGDPLRVVRTDLDATLTQSIATIEGECGPRLQPLEECLRMLLWLRLTGKHGAGLMIHSASTMFEGKAYCFPAYGGTGKSTLARMTPGDMPLCDELSLLTRDKHGQWRVWPCPFWNWTQNLRADVDPGQSWPLAGIGFLQQAPATSLSPIGTGEALTRLMQQTIAFDRFPMQSSQTFGLAADLIEDMQQNHTLGILHLRKGDEPYPAMRGKSA